MGEVRVYLSRAVVASILAGVLAAAAFIAISPPAANANLPTALFKAKIKGTQINDWTANYSGRSVCEPGFGGKGREVIRFRSIGWTPVRVIMYNNARYAAFRDQEWTASFYTPKRIDPPPFRLRGTVTRSSQFTGGMSPPECAVADGTGEWKPPKRDCGRKTIKNRTLLAKTNITTGWLSLESVRTPFPSYGGYENCKIFGWAWPTFMVHDDKNGTAGVDLDVKRTLRNKKFKKLIFIGRGKSRHTQQGIKGNTRIEWSMDMRRVR